MSRSDRAQWVLMFALSYVIGLLCLVARVLQASASGLLYSHPAPFATIAQNARHHAETVVKR